MKIQSLLHRALGASALLLGLGVTGQAQAATFSVTNANDAGAGSLRQAVLDANTAPSDDTIVFDSTAFFFSSSIVLTSGQIVVADHGALSIVGPSANPQNLEISGNDASRIFLVDASARLSLSQIYLTHGYSAEGGLLNNGGAIFNGGTLTIDNVAFFDNHAFAGSGGGAIYNRGALTIRKSRFAYNSAKADSANSGGVGGAIDNGEVGAALTITDSELYGNEASFGGAIFNVKGSQVTISRSSLGNNGASLGGVLANYGDATLDASTFYRNSGNQGGVLYNANASATIRNCTFASNSAEANGGAISNNQSSSGPSSLDVESSTFSANICDLGGAIFNGDGNTLRLNNSIVALNSPGVLNGPNIYGVVTAGDYNLVDNTSGATLTGSHNVIGQDPKLAPLYYSGGTPQTFGFLAGSPALDAGNTTLSTDQRGSVRPVDAPTLPDADGGNGADIGAVELNEAPQSGSNFVINTVEDHSDGVCGPTDCTLSDAIIAANADPDTSTLTFDDEVFATKRTIKSTNFRPIITSNVNILGPSGAGQGVTIGGAGIGVQEGTVNIANLTFKDCQGSGVVVFSGTATVSACAFINGSIGVQSGGNSSGSANTTVNSCTFVGQDNSAVYSTATRSGLLALDSCTLVGGANGVTFDRATVRLSNSLVVGNQTNIRDFGGTYNNTGPNITSGTAAGAGLDPAGLKDNGGPTPTIALLRGSLAINAGATSLSTDQRGTVRDSTPDIGAFEFVPKQPLVESLSPLNASDKVGNRRTFTLTVSDPNGVGDIKEAWLLINTQLSWNGGATLIYVPSAISPTRGQLFLRSGDAFLAPLDIGVGSRAVLDNGALNVSARDVSVSVSGNSLTLTVTATIRDGLVGVNRVFARVVDKAGNLDPDAFPSDNGYRRFGSYTVTPQFKGETNSAPTLSRLQPSTTNTVLPSTGLGPVQSFAFSAFDADGTGDIESVWFTAGKSVNWTKSATFIYTPKTRRLVLRSDDGQSFLGGGVVGSAGIIENSQVRVDLSKVRASIGADGKTLTVFLPLQAKRGLIGQNKVYLRVQDLARATAPNGDAQGYVQSGAWNVAQGAAGTANAATSGGGS